MKKLGIIACWIAFVGCQNLRPDSLRIPEYPDFEDLMIEQVDLLKTNRAKKEVWLDGKSEVQILSMDSTKWLKELSFFKEINPNQPRYIGVFAKSGDELNQTLTLAEGENGALKKTSFSRNDDGFEIIQASFHEDKDVYVHHREIEIRFEDGKLNSFRIDGYQKMMFKDTVRFRIKVEVN